MKELSRLMEERYVADYGAIPLTDESDAKEGIKDAEHILDEINDLLEKLIQK